MIEAKKGRNWQRREREKERGMKVKREGEEEKRRVRRRDLRQLHLP